MLRPEPLEPQLAQMGDAPPAGDRWLHEQKFDGYRLTAKIVDGDVRVWSRNAVDWTTKLPTLVAALRQLDLAYAAFDGELVVGAGRPEDFNALQSALAAGRGAPLRFVLFDLLHVDGFDIGDAPLVERKSLLEELLGTSPPKALSYSTHVEGHGDAVFEHAVRARLEGIVSKRADAPYRGGRGGAWRKTKHVDSEDFAAVGYMRRAGQRSGIGSLLLARPTTTGWRYAGRVGSGFSDAQLREIARRIGDAGGREPTAEVPDALAADLRSALWFPPMFVVDAFSRGTGAAGALRQPSLKAVRLDRSPEELRASRAASDAATATPPSRARRRATVVRADLGGDVGTTRPPAPASTPSAATPARRAPPPRARGEEPQRPVAALRASKPSRVGRADARVSSPDKPLYPADGITKQDVADYYLAVADHLLPEIAGRPLSVIRCPDGVGGTCFFQKHRTAGMAAVGSEPVKVRRGEAGRALVVRDVAGLMELVQHNTLEFHPWGAHADDPGRADRLVFDLDPGPGVAWAAVQAAARTVRAHLQSMGLASWLRTTGGKGLHVVVPLRPAVAWDVAKPFAKAFATAMELAEPRRYVSALALARRPGKIFVDYLRNGRGATAVASYSLRARPGAPVAMPISWDELDALPGGDAYTLSSALAHLARRRRDPWAGIDECRQELGGWD